MPRTKRAVKQPERTGSEVAHQAGQILNGKHVAEALGWLEDVVDNVLTSADARAHAVTLLGAMASAKRVAASALTQR